MCTDTNSATIHIQRQRGRDTPVQYAAMFAPQPLDWGATCADTGNALSRVIVKSTDN